MIRIISMEQNNVVVNTIDYALMLYALILYVIRAC